MNGFRTLASALVLSALALPHAASAAETRRYWDHAWSNDCKSQRRPMMQAAINYANSWCRSRGGLDKHRTEMSFSIDKGQKTGPSFKTRFCEVKSTITCK